MSTPGSERPGRYPPTPLSVRVAGVASLAGIAVTHLLDLPDKLAEARYMAVLFCALIAASVLLAVPTRGIGRRAGCGRSPAC